MNHKTIMPSRRSQIPPPIHVVCFHLDKILEMTNLTKQSDEQIGCYLVPVVEEEIHWDGAWAPFWSDWNDCHGDTMGVYTCQKSLS